MTGKLKVWRERSNEMPRRLSGGAQSRGGARPDRGWQGPVNRDGSLGAVNEALAKLALGDVLGRLMLDIGTGSG
jgi:hypothetical protein